MRLQPRLCQTWSEIPKTGILTTRLNSCRSTQNVMQKYDARRIISCSHAGLPQDERANVRLSQDKNRRRTVPAVRLCGSCANFSLVVCFAAFLWQPYKAQSHCTVSGRQSYSIRKTNSWVRTLTSVVRTHCVSCDSLAEALLTLQQPCVQQTSHKTLIRLYMSKI